jgi:hypothetical protein
MKRPQRAKVALVQSQDPRGPMASGKHYKRRVSQADTQLLVLLDHLHGGLDVLGAESLQSISAGTDALAFGGQA